jgi:fatty acid synthase subunit alpha, fungi type
VSTTTDEWIAAEVLRDEFLHAQSLLDAIETTEDTDLAEATVELATKFLTYISQNIHEAEESTPARTALLFSVFKHFTSTYLSVKDVHSLTASYDIEVRKAVLISYFQAFAVLQEQGVTDIPQQPNSALLAAAARGDASIFAVFGGQGTNEVYFDELQSLYDIYKPFVADFLTTVTNEVLIPLAAAHSSTPYYTHGFDIMAWLSGTSPRPNVSYLASVPISFPLIGLTPLVQYLVACHVASSTPGSLRSLISGATGHSQGIISAVAISASSSFASFTENAIKALNWLFFSGLRGQEAFPITSIEPSIVQDAIEGGEGTPSPMLSVTGLALGDLEPHIKKTNLHLPSNSQLCVSLYNGPRAFVVNGPPRALYGLVTNLRKIKAESGKDQSKVPFSQRKPVFSIRFLVVGVPYHSAYLEGVREKVIRDLEGRGFEELWQGSDLGVKVYNTEDGTCICTARS